MRLCRLLLAFVCLSIWVAARQINQQVQSVRSGDRAEADSKPKKELTADERKAAASMLKAREPEARALPPELRAYALQQIARGYSQIEPAKAPAILVDSFTATLAIESDDKFTKNSLQRDILFQLLAFDHKKVNELLPQAEDQPRSEVTRELIRRAVRAKNVDEAADLIDQVSRTTEFPYAEGAELMASFPKEESWRRSALFSEALASYAGHEHKKVMLGNGFPEMITSNWRDLPPDQVEQGIDTVLKQAKENDQAATVSLASDKGDQARFDTIYEFRLFQLLPILREINKGKAEEIMRDQQTVSGMLAKFPNGQESLSPRPQDGAQPPRGGERRGMSMMVNMPDRKGQPTGQAPPQVDEAQAWQAQADRIVASAAQDPKQALAQAQTLPTKMQAMGNRPIRAEALRGIATSTLKSNPTIAKQAVADMVKATQDLEPHDQARELVDVAKLYLKLDDEENAKKTLDSATSKANDAIKADANAEDPNQALKAYWPSAAAWQSILRTAEKISPAYAQKLGSEISDDQIRVIAQIALADELAGAPAGRVIVSEKRAKSNRNMTMMSTEDDDN